MAFDLVYNTNFTYGYGPVSVMSIVPLNVPAQVGMT